MIMLNFSHPFTAAQLGQLAALTGVGVDRVTTVPMQSDRSLTCGSRS
jgi:hypothetical protein